MIGGSVCSKRSPWLHTDCMQIAYRLHTAKNVWKSCIWTADKNLNESDPRSNEHYLSSSENKAWEKFRPVRDLNPWPLRYRCSALPTELKSQLELVIMKKGLIFTTAQVVHITARITFIQITYRLLGDRRFSELWKELPISNSWRDARGFSMLWKGAPDCIQIAKRSEIQWALKRAPDL